MHRASTLLALGTSRQPASSVPRTTTSTPKGRAVIRESPSAFGVAGSGVESVLDLKADSFSNTLFP